MENGTPEDEGGKGRDKGEGKGGDKRRDKRRGSARKKKRPQPPSSFRLTVPVSVEERKRQHKVLGIDTRLGICSYIRILLEVNETLPRHKKMTDDQLTRQVVTEFPNARSTRRLLSGEVPFGYWRTRYNHNLIGLGSKPARKSRRYTAKGRLANSRTGRVLIGEKLKKVEEEIAEEIARGRRIVGRQPVR